MRHACSMWKKGCQPSCTKHAAASCTPAVMHAVTMQPPAPNQQLNTRVSCNCTRKQLPSAPKQQCLRVHRCWIAPFGRRLLSAQGRKLRALAHHTQRLAYRAAAGLRKKASINRQHVETVSNTAHRRTIHQHTFSSERRCSLHDQSQTIR